MALELKAEIRKESGRKLKTLRKKGLIPAVVYGPGHKSLAIQVVANDFQKVFQEAGESALVKLRIGDQIKNVLIHEVATDPIEDRFIHIDFYQVPLNKPIKTKIPFVFEGEAPAVKTMDGILIKNLTEIEIEALPKDLPHEIRIDISSLDSFDKHIRIKDLKLPEGVKILEDIQEVIVSVIPPRTEAELKALEEKPEEKIEEVEVAGEKAEKPEEEISPAEKSQEKKDGQK